MHSVKSTQLNSAQRKYFFVICASSNIFPVTADHDDPVMTCRSDVTPSTRRQSRIRFDDPLLSWNMERSEFNQLSSSAPGLERRFGS